MLMSITDPSLQGRLLERSEWRAGIVHQDVNRPNVATAFSTAAFTASASAAIRLMAIAFRPRVQSPPRLRGCVVPLNSNPRLARRRPTAGKSRRIPREPPVTTYLARQ